MVQPSRLQVLGWLWLFSHGVLVCVSGLSSSWSSPSPPPSTRSSQEKTTTRRDPSRPNVEPRHLQVRRPTTRHRKPKHYWENLDNIHKEICAFWKFYNISSTTLPSETLLGYAQRHDLRAALRRYGGSHLVANELNISILPGTWKEAVLHPEVQQLLLFDPNLASAHPPDIQTATTKQPPKPSATHPHQTKKKSRGYWTLQTVITELYDYTDRYQKLHGRPCVWMPRPSELVYHGRNDLKTAMVRYGNVVQTVAGLVPYHEWYYLEGQLELLLKLRDYMKEYPPNANHTATPTFPVTSRIRQRQPDLYRLVQYFGGRTYLAAKLGFSSGTTPEVYQFGPFDMEVAISLLQFVRDQHATQRPPCRRPTLCMPSASQLRDAQRPDLHASIVRYGGYENVARRLGLALVYPT